MTSLNRTLNSNVLPGSGVLSALFGRIVNTVNVWSERADGRRELAELSFRDMTDIGLDPAEVEREIAKPFWRA